MPVGFDDKSVKPKSGNSVSHNDISLHFINIVIVSIKVCNYNLKKLVSNRDVGLNIFVGVVPLFFWRILWICNLL